MTPEELDLAIEALLEENPNQEKPVRKRKIKEREIERRLRSSWGILSDKMIMDLLGEEVNLTIATVKVTYTKKTVHLGKVKGWYDDIKEIAKACNEDRNDIRLEKCLYMVDGHTRFAWDGYANIFKDVYSVRLRYYTDDGRCVESVGVYRDTCVVNEKPSLEEGIYTYDEEMKEYINEHFIKAPDKVKVDDYKIIRCRWNPEELFKLDKKGKYRLYQKMLREHHATNMYSGTIRVQKGNEIGLRNQVLLAVNDKLKADKEIGNYEDYTWHDYNSFVDEIIQDYECDYYNVVNEYIW